MSKFRVVRIIFSAFMASSIAQAAEVRGSLQGVEGLHPSAPPHVDNLSYWEVPNGAVDLHEGHANAEFDLDVVLTGEGLAEMTRPVAVPVMGGRCRPGTVVVSPNGVLTVQNQDWFAHEFFATESGQNTPIASFGPELTGPRSDRQVQIAQPGTYLLRDRQAPLFRCWIVVGPGQGKMVAAAADSSFHIPQITDGTYAVRVYFEGRLLAEQPAVVSHEHDAVVPPMNLGGPAPAAPAAPASPATPPPANPAAAPAPAPAENHHHHRGH